MPRTWACPFWTREEKNCIVCEAARIRFKSHDEFSSFAGRYCANVNGWHQCTISGHCVEQCEKRKEP